MNKVTVIDKVKLNLIEKNKHRLEIGVDNIPIPYTEENRKFLNIAKAGSGKTQTIYSLIFGGSKESKGIKDFNETMIVYERKGTDFIPKLFRRKSGKDFLFDPRDIQGIRWNIMADLLDEDGSINEAMVDFYTVSTLPISNGNSAHFDKQSQGVWKATLLRECGQENPSNKGLIDFILSHGDLISLRKALIKDPTVIKYGMAGVVKNALTTDSQGVADGQGSSVMATLNDLFKKICRREFYFKNGNFSVRNFMNTIDEYPDRRLFIANTTDMAGSFNLYFSLFFNLIFKYGLALENNNKRRVWFIWDEIQSIGSNGNQALGKYVIGEFVNFLAESRSKGFCELAATQSLPQLEELIGKEGVRALFQLLSTKIIGQYDEPDGQQFLCKYIGEQEIERTKESYSEGNKINDGRTNKSSEEKNKKVILESELSSLPPLNFFVKIGSYPVAQLAFNYQEPRNITQTLIKRDIPFFDMELVSKIEQDEKDEEDFEKLEKAMYKVKDLGKKEDDYESLSKASKLSISRIKYLLSKFNKENKLDAKKEDVKESTQEKPSDEELFSAQVEVMNAPDEDIVPVISHDDEIDTSELEEEMYKDFEEQMPDFEQVEQDETPFNDEKSVLV